ncbi:FecR family protein [Pedobacter sp. MC2016-14]|uniref:FecR family protein n=1 Tax=Pedobacter sp. MC2016-14 TaxID=2897327 RepID=UPI001E415F15|nr:FecR family protein [Pedobacter sp. MC2016-14]MCD0488343.1 FecR family protein [Pedobacter sp. MC2016-14]
MKEYPYNPQVIDQFFSGSLPEEKHNEVLDWFMSLSEAEQLVFIDIHLGFVERHNFTAEQNLTTGFAQLENRILERKYAGRRTIRLVLQMAAAILPLMLFWFLFRPDGISPKPGISEFAPKTVKIIRLKNTLNHAHTIQLPDSSEVILYPGAMLQYPAQFAIAKREVELFGKAFFEVRHKQDHPFTVISGALTTVVLGTSFWVDGADLNRISVKVKTGKVGVLYAKQPALFLLPTEKALFTTQTGRLVKLNAAKKIRLSVPLDAQLPSAIVFNNTPLRQVAKVLAEAFGKTIVVDQVNGAELIVSLNTKGKSLTAILQEVKLQTQIQYEIKEHNIHISKPQ